MQSLKIAFFLLLWFATLIPGISSSATLTGVSANPDPVAPQANVAVTATKAGTQNCGWRVDFGDGAVSQKMGFPGSTKAAPAHVYAQAGSYTIRAFGVNHGSKPKCAGSVTTSIVVKATPLQIQETAVRRFAFARPVILHKFGVPMPGGVMAWTGRGFGPQRGKVRLHFQRWDGSNQAADLEIVEWSPTLVGARIPSGLDGFQRQIASVVVTAHSGRETQPEGLELVPATDWLDLSQGDARVVRCGTDGNSDTCNETSDRGAGALSVSDGENFFPEGPIYGYHWNAWGAVGDDHGSDAFEISLKNGWVIASASTIKTLSSSNESIHGPSPSAPMGQSHWAPSYVWRVSPNDSAQYETMVSISGPRGVPYK